MYDTIIIRYGEIFLKGEFIMRKFKNRLIRNIKRKLDGCGLEADIFEKRHRIYIKNVKKVGCVDDMMSVDRVVSVDNAGGVDDVVSMKEVWDVDDAKGVKESTHIKTANAIAGDASKMVSKVFGIVSASPAIETKAKIPDISRTAVDLAREIIHGGETFAVRAKRTGTHEFKSRDIEKYVGSQIQGVIDCAVNLDNPDKTIFIEIRDNLAFVFDTKIKGVGGLPYGTQEKVITLLSSGIDSPVSSWMMMRRGCEIVAVHFGNKNEIEEILKKLEEYADAGIKTYIIPENIIPLKQILDKLNRMEGIGDASKYICIICKRMMYKIAKRISETENACGIVTGESIGQVASQTLENLEVISTVASPVYRPLIGMDKEDIIKIAREIGTFDLTVDKKCRYLPQKVATKSKLEVIEEIEGKININRIIEDVWEKIDIIS